MRKPRVFFRLMRRAWRRWLMPPSETRAISSIDAREFSDLLVSGRTKDLKILAGRLSQHAHRLAPRLLRVNEYFEDRRQIYPDSRNDGYGISKHRAVDERAPQ